MDAFLTEWGFKLTLAALLFLKIIKDEYAGRD